MKKRSITTITVSTEQAAQLRQIASVYGISLTDLLGRLIDSEVRSGTIPDVVPGFQIARTRNRLKIATKKMSWVFPLTKAEEIAASLEEMTRGETSILRGKRRMSYAKHFYTDLNGNTFVLRRRGRGVLLYMMSSPKWRELRQSFSPRAILAVAKAIRNAAAIPR
jgi:hypothetical protein